MFNISGVTILALELDEMVKIIPHESPTLSKKHLQQNSQSFPRRGNSPLNSYFHLETLGRL